jgi:hypothetical protein
MNYRVATGKSSDQIWEQLGEQILAPLLHDFVWWLHRQALRDGVDQLFFLARDGYMLQKAYQAVIPTQEQLPNYYMYASRRVFNFPSITKLDERALRFLMGDRVEMPVGRYLERIGLDAPEVEAAVRAVGFESSQSLVLQTDFHRLKQLFRRLEPQVLASAAAERRRLLRYADSMANWDGRKSALVDIGWHGNLQVSLRKVMGLPADRLRGYYFGLHTGIKARSAGEKMRAYLDETRLADWVVCWLTFRRSREVFEIFFTGRESSIVGIGEPSPGQFEAIREGLKMPAEMAYKLDVLQDAAMKSVRGVNYSRSEVLRRLVRLMSLPSRAEADALGDVPHTEGFGGYGRSDYLARPRYSLRGYLRRVGQLAHDWRKTFWRPGFVRRLW